MLNYFTIMPFLPHIKGGKFIQNASDIYFFAKYTLICDQTISGDFNCKIVKRHPTLILNNVIFGRVIAVMIILINTSPMK